METCSYDKVEECEPINAEDGKVKDICKPFWKQLFVTTGVWSIYFVLGLCYGAPNVVIPQIRRDANSTEAVTDDMASWITSVHGYSALPWLLILPILTRRFGRRIPFAIVCTSTIAAFIVFSCSRNAAVVLISEVMQGCLVASNMTVLIVVVTEYTAPKYRGIFMTIKSTIFFWGVLIANITGTFWHWKKIGVYAFIFALYPATVIFWPESPSWLAMKGRFEESAAAHHWLKGFSADSEKELQSLIYSQKVYLKKQRENKKGIRNHMRSIREKILTKGFYMPLLLSMCVMSLYNFSGKFVCTMYSIELIKKITKSESTAYMGMLILEVVTIFSMHIGCILSKYLKRRTLLLGSSSTGIIFLFVISLYLYLVKLSVVEENKIVSILLLTTFSMTISCGPMILACTVYGELTPLRYRSSTLPILALYSEFIMASVLKTSPYIFAKLDLHGAFLFYGLSASVFAFILYKYLPESKDKTLQEIENYFVVEPIRVDGSQGLMSISRQ